MNRIKLIAATILVAATLLAASAHAVTAQSDSTPAIASLCCYIKK